MAKEQGEHDASANGDTDDSALALVVFSDQAACSLQENQVLPLLGKPYFTCIISKSNVESPYQLVIPRNFQHLLPSAMVPATLYCRNRAWELNYYGNKDRLRRFDLGWRTFAVDNGLKIGDGCVFELVDVGEYLLFNVQILDGTVPVPVPLLS